jgi:hypothetical protein
LAKIKGGSKDLDDRLVMHAKTWNTMYRESIGKEDGCPSIDGLDDANTAGDGGVRGNGAGSTIQLMSMRVSC